MKKQFDTIYKKTITGLKKPEVRKRITASFVVTVFVFLIISMVINLFPKETEAAPTFRVRTGTFVGNGGALNITGLGFAPEAVIIKPSTIAGIGTLFKTSAMDEAVIGNLASATADATLAMKLEKDGFLVTGANTNPAGVLVHWTAFGGSNCTSTGFFCVGAYTGGGAGTKAIPTGFQPDIAIVKAATTVAPAWRSSSMPVNTAQFTAATTQDTTGAWFTTLDATGFTVGASNNTAVRHHFMAFRNLAGFIGNGTFAGNGTSQSVSGIGFQPNMVLVKNANNATAQGAVFTTTQHHGNLASFFTDTANVTTAITSLDATGFSVGAHATTNGAGNAIFWVAFGGAATASGSGTFQMATGSYVGNGEFRNVSGLTFKPDLVIVKGNNTQAGVFRTNMHGGSNSSFLDAATADTTFGIVAISGDGFSLGNGAMVNATGITYHWTAYGNAWDPTTHTGSADFVIGSYFGNGLDNRNIVDLPFQPNLVTVKTTAATAAAYRTSAQAGDLSGFFAATAEAANVIQALNPNGFQVGTHASANTSAGLYHFFAFRNGPSFTVGTYSGNGGTQTITTTGTLGTFRPDYLWVKQTGAVQGVQKTDTMAVANSVPFIAVAEITTAFSGFTSTGFGITNAPETNTTGTNNYRFMAWKKNVGVNVTLGQVGTQAVSMSIPSTNNYIGAAFTLITASSSANINSITITETGTVNANVNLSNIVIRYEQTGVCTYDGTETIFGSVAGFNVSEVATITGNMFVSTAQVCVYVILNVGSGASHNQTIELEITNPATGILTNAGVVAPTSPVVLGGTTTLLGLANQNPNSPTSLTQQTSPGAVTIGESTWTNDNTPNLGFTITDPDGDQVRYRVQIDGSSSAFTNLVLDYTHTTTSISGTAFAFTVGQAGGTYTVGTQGMTLPDLATGFWWRVRAIDASGAESPNIEYGVAGTMDFRVDATAPAGGSINDGQLTGGDLDWNTDGSLNQYLANWTATAPNSNISGLLRYEFALRRGGDNFFWTPGAPGSWGAVEYWFNNGTSTTFTTTNLNLQTGTIYYVSLRTFDNAGNIATIHSNGLRVTPFISFSVNNNLVNFSDLGNVNNWTDTRSTVVTVSTNASSGYTVRGYVADHLRSLAYVGQFIASFIGTWVSPQPWSGFCNDNSNFCGFGYTSSDTNVQGTNRFNGGLNFASYSQSPPGDVLADNLGPVSGQTGAINNEQFTVTHRTSVSSSQTASTYQTILYLIATANF